MKYSKELVIGITTLATIICLIGGYNFLKGKSVFSAKQEYYAFYEHVHGLEVGQPVTVNGYKIGQVSEIKFDVSFGGPLLVGFHISKPLDFGVDTKFEIYDMDIMGAKGLQMVPGKSKNIAVSGDTLLGDIQISLTEQVTKQFVPIKDGTEKLMSTIDSTLKSVTMLSENVIKLIEVNQKSITRAAGNVDSLSAAFFSHRDDFMTIATNAALFSEELASSSFSDAISQANQTMHSIDLVLHEIHSGSGSFSKLLSSDELYYEMTSSLLQLDLLLEDLRNHPKRYVHFSIFGRKESIVDTTNLN
jgi:phospholipid/cholesterol/gamma-HCH transport system substrate-binding protein